MWFDVFFCVLRCGSMSSMHAYILNFHTVVTSAKEVMFSSLFVCLSVCLLATLRKNFWTGLHEIFREGWQ